MIPVMHCFAPTVTYAEERLVDGWQETEEAPSSSIKPESSMTFDARTVTLEPLAFDPGDETARDAAACAQLGIDRAWLHAPLPGTTGRLTDILGALSWAINPKMKTGALLVSSPQAIEEARALGSRAVRIGGPMEKEKTTETTETEETVEPSQIVVEPEKTVTKTTTTTEDE